MDPSVPKMPPQLLMTCMFMRGGTSRGPYFLKQHLPSLKNDRASVDKILLRAMGSPDLHQIDGLGGGRSVTSKVAIISRSKEQNVDIDYTFAQVTVDRAVVDWEPSCGNMLAGVGPAAIEMGLIKPRHPVTPVTIRATNNGALVEAIIQTPDHTVTYDGDQAIAGVPGTAAPITLNFMHVVGSKTGGKLLPTGHIREEINGVEVTCIDVAMPIVIAKASSLKKTGYEKAQELDEDVDFFSKLEAIRVIAGKKMGLGDVTGRVIPKFVIVSEPKTPTGNINARYFVPTKTHGAMAVTGAICVACCSVLKGSVADDLSTKTVTGKNLNRVIIEHPSGSIQITLESEQEAASTMIVHKAGVMRTARLIFEGHLRVRADGLDNFAVHGAPHKGADRYMRYQQQVHQTFRNMYRFKESGQLASGEEGTEEEEWVGDDKSLQPSLN